MNNKRTLIILVGLLLIVSIACTLPGFSSSQTTQSDTSGQSPTQSGGGAAEGQTSPQGSDEATLAPSGETGSFDNLDQGLDSLNSYRSTFKWSVEGKDDTGAQQKGSMEIFQEINKTTSENHLRMTTEGVSSSASQPGVFETYATGGMSYMVTDENGTIKCTGFTINDAANQNEMLFKPSQIIGGVNNAQLVESGVMMNGVLTRHYRFDQSGLSFGTFESASGEAWVAQEGNFVVKYMGQATGKSALIGKVLDGTITWEFSLDAINQDFRIVLPAECEKEKPATDIPVPPNATENSVFSGMISFKSPDTPGVVADYYRQQMPTQGWTAGEESVMGEDLITLSYTKDARTLSIMITKENAGGSSVLITEAK